MRDFDTSVVKSFTAMAPIEDKCQLGLCNCPDLLFSMPNESNANMTVNSLIAFEERMTQHGLEGVFHVVSPSGNVLNMFREPGMCTSDAIKTWCEDVIQLPRVFMISWTLPTRLVMASAIVTAST